MTWAFVKVYLDPGAELDADGFLLAIWKPIVAAHAGSKALSFFLRYTDDSGPHLRLRMRSEREGPGLAGTVRARVAKAGSASQGGAITEAIYEPETEKYGGCAGLTVSETHFDRSSAFALDVITATPGQMAPRILLATVEMRWMIGMIMPDRASRADLMTRYAAYWQEFYAQLVGSPIAPADPFEELRALADDLGQDGAALADPLGLGAAHERWRDCVRQDIASLRVLSDSDGLSVPEEMIVLNWGHTLCNRLGVTLRGEIAVTELLRSRDRA